MHFPRMIERWAAPEAQALFDLVKRQKTTTGGGLLGGLIPTTTVSQATATDAPADNTTQDNPATTQKNTPTPTPATTQTQPTTTNKPTTNSPSTTQAPSTSKPSSAPSSTSMVTITSQTTAPSNTPAATNSLEQVSATPSSSAAASKDNSGGFGGVNGKSVATGVGVVVGVVGGFAVILLAVYMWRRHQRRKEMERIGSMEELPRAPSPGPLSRSYTRGHGARQPIDDDEDDFLTPMDTMPNTVRLDEWNSTKSSPTGSDTMYDDNKSIYAESVYQEDLAYDDQHMHEYPMPPPPVMTASNGRYYSGDFTGMSSPQSPQTPSSSSNGGAIPTYSAMNKYAAYSAGASAPPTSSTPRPGGGYRAHDSYDAGGYV